MAYDGFGKRCRKNSVYYLYDGDKLIKERRNGTSLVYFYDTTGICGFRYHDFAGENDTTAYYFYLKNLQGDVTAILDQNGNVVAEYLYDAWGKCYITYDPTGIGAINPIRYRSYHYDTETGLYYLNSRYYDPNTGRFINADMYVSTGQGILGNNMFAYCGNDPINRIDRKGHFWGSIWNFARTAVTETGKAMGAPAYAGFGGVALGDGFLPFGDIVALIGAGLITVGAVGMGVSIAAKTSSLSIPKVEEKSDAVLLVPPVTIFIYRYGGTNPGNLTPSQRDVDLYPITGKGLSFSTVPKAGAAMTTIEALNATGVVYAVCDGVGHVSVHPIGGTLEDWHNAGSSSVWTTAVKSVVVKWNGGN